jgi:hypothetical protein
MSPYSHDHHSVNPASWRVGLPWPLGPRVEDPVRVKEFGEAIRSLAWTQEQARESLDILFHHISKLTQGEVRYYYMRRKWARLISWWLNVGTWALGTCGVLIPFVQPLAKSADLLPWGYLALAFAGTLVVADRLFLATEGHGRYTTTQLQVEAAFSDFALSWNVKMLAVDRHNTEASVLEALILAQGYAKQLHVTLGLETAEWIEKRRNAQKEAEKYASQKTAGADGATAA